MATATSTALTGGRANARDESVIIRQKKSTWPTIGTYIGVAVIVLWCLIPFYWMVVTAFRDVGYTFDSTPWPTHVTLQNFTTAFSTKLGNHFGRALLNSVLIGVVTTVIGVAVGVFAAYALARIEFKSKGLVLGFILGASMFPAVALLTPLFQLFTNLHWIGQYQALIIPDISFVLPLTVYTLTAFFGEMPWDLEEAARIDGCTAGQAFRRVILPLAAPGLFTTAILAFTASWNEFLLASELSSDKTAPVTVAIAQFAGSQPHHNVFSSGWEHKADGRPRSSSHWEHATASAPTK